MAALTRKEIIAELRKLGINNISELKFYLKEYKTYYALQNPRKISYSRISKENLRNNHSKLIDI